MRIEVVFDASAITKAKTQLVAILEARRRAAFAALNQEGERIMAESKALVPVDEGVLRASGHVVADEAAGTVTLAYGGPAADYAVIQHEDTELQHDDGQAKYLEEPYLAAIPEIQDRLVDAVNRAT